MKSLATSPIMMDGIFVLAFTITGIIEASTTLNPDVFKTLQKITSLNTIKLINQMNDIIFWESSQVHTFNIGNFPHLAVPQLWINYCLSVFQPFSHGCCPNRMVNPKEPTI